MAEQIIDIKEIQKIIAADKAITNLDAAYLKFVQDIQKGKKQINDTAKSTDGIAQKSSEYAKMLNKAAESHNKLLQNAKQLESQQKTLASTQAKLNTSRTAANKKIIEQRIELQKANKSTKDLIIAQKAEKQSIEQLSAVNRILEKRLAGVSSKTEEGRKKAERLRGAIDRNNKKINEFSSSLTKQRRNIGNYGSAFDSLGGKFPMLTRGVQSVNVAFKALLANPIVAVIAAIVAVFAGLVKIFKDTDEGGTRLESIFNGLKAVADVLKNRIVDLMQAFKLLFSGQFREAADKFKESMTGVGDAINEAYNAAKDYIVQLDLLDDRITGSISSQATILKQFREQIALSKDQTKTDQERLRALSAAQSAAEQYFGNIRKWEQERFDLDVKNAAARIDLTSDELANFIALDGERMQELMSTNDRYRQAWNQLGDDVIKSLEEQYAKMDEADTMYFKRTSEIISLRSGIEKRLNAEREKFNENIRKSEEETANFILDLEKEMFSELESEMQENHDKGLEILAEEEERMAAIAQANINAKQREYQMRIMLAEATGESVLTIEGEILQEQINNTMALLDAQELSATERIQLEDKLAQLQFELNALLIESDNEVEENRKKNDEDRLARIQEISRQVADIALLGFDFASALRERELADIEQKKEQGILSEKEAARQTAEIQLKQAKADRAASLFNIAVNTALAVTKVTAQTGIGAALAIPLVIGSGALQAAAVLSQPLPTVPAFAKGTDNAPSSFVAGEEKRELMQLSTGKLMMVDKPTYFEGNQFKGAKIFTNKETEYIMSRTASPNFSGSSFSDERVVGELKAMRKDIKKIQRPIVSKTGKQIGWGNSNHFEIRFKNL